MPRVALTQEQRERNAVADISKSIMDGLHAQRGLSRKSNDDFCKFIGISRTTWWRWNSEGIDEAEFGKVLAAAMRVGLTIRVEHPVYH